MNLDSIKARLAAAGPEPYIATSASWDDATGDVQFQFTGIKHIRVSDSKFLCNAKQDLAALIAEVERLRRQSASASHEEATKE